MCVFVCMDVYMEREKEIEMQQGSKILTLGESE